VALGLVAHRCESRGSDDGCQARPLRVESILPTGARITREQRPRIRSNQRIVNAIEPNLPVGCGSPPGADVPQL
jgi:hypothetical protein